MNTNKITSYLQKHADEQGFAPAFSFITDDEVVESVSFKELSSEVTIAAAELSRLALPGSRIVLLIPQGLAYVKVFLACLQAGLVAVPLYPLKNSAHAELALKMIGDCTASLAVCPADQKIMLARELAPTRAVDLESLFSHRDLGSEDIELGSSELAFLQYTSGSTGSPKGVMVSHQNIRSNLLSLIEATGCSRSNVFCNWLPLFHDLGLINTLLLPLYLGAHSILMSPTTFMRNPFLWLKTISENQNVMAGAPNFAFEHCVDRVGVEKCCHLNLSSWKLAFNAAEPIDPRTIERFCRHFSSAGFKREAFYPAYGMAEATVFICGQHLSVDESVCFEASGLLNGIASAVASEAADSKELVPCGSACSGHSLVIVDPESCEPLADCRIGEIWFAGPSVSSGYFGRSGAPESGFGSRLDSKNFEYLRTGDLGFIFNNRVFVTGRIKDAMIVRGRNFYPQDFERAAFGAYAGLRRTGLVAFESDGNVVMLVEVDPSARKSFNYDAAYRRISQVIFDSYEVLLGDIVFLKAGQVPRTSSGKVRRAESRRRYVAEGLSSLWKRAIPASIASGCSSATEAYLLEQCELLFGVRVAPSQNFFSLGGNSILALKLLVSINERFGTSFSSSLFFDCDSLSAMAENIDASTNGDANRPQVAPLQSESGFLTNTQRSLWLDDRISGGTSHYNLGVVYRIEGILNVEALSASLETLLLRHDALTVLYSEEDGSPIGNQSVEGFKIDEVSAEPGEIDEIIRVAMSTPFDLARDLKTRAVLVRTSPENHTLIWTFHHIAVDGYSLLRLENDLGAAYERFLLNDSWRGNLLGLSRARQGSFLVNSQAHLAKCLSYWRDTLNGIPAKHGLLLDYHRPPQFSHRGASVTGAFSEALSKRLAHFAAKNGVSLFSLLQTAFCSLLHRFSGDTDIVIGSPYLGRDSVESLDKVGCFVEFLIQRLRVDPRSTFVSHLRRNVQTLKDAIDHRGLLFSDVVEAINFPRSASYHPISQIFFSYNDVERKGLSLQGAVVSIVEFPRYSSRFDLALEITRQDGVLTYVWEYCSDLFSADTVNSLSSSLKALLDALDETLSVCIGDLTIASRDQERRLISLGSGICRESDRTNFLQLLMETASQRSERICLRDECNELSYAQLVEQVERLARSLNKKGVGHQDLVAVCMNRGVDAVICMLAVMRAGGFYVPLDASYPLQRLDYILGNAYPKVIVAQPDTKGILPFDASYEILDYDDLTALDGDAPLPALSSIQRDSLAYMMYTSGSSGSPKGVPITHGNVLSLFQGLENQIGKDVGDPAVWLATTSFGFDISVLELFWTLARGDCVFVQPDKPSFANRSASQDIEFGLFFFASDCESRGAKFDLLLESAKFADTHGVQHVWLPERHFHKFGGQFANPAVAAAAVAAVTKNVRINAGSVVLPLHDPLRVAEEWSMVDNLSGGRASISIASGWQPNDFVLAPDRFADRHAIMRDYLQVIKRLLNGETVERVNGAGQSCAVAIYPKPVQRPFPIHITAAQNIETFKYAGSIGAQVLTHLLGQTVAELEHKIRAYRNSLVQNGFSPDIGKVTLMLHTFISDDEEHVMHVIQDPFRSYLSDSVSLLQPLADALGLDLMGDRDRIVEHAFQRYVREGALFGNPSTCFNRLLGLRHAGVDDVACLIDFGIDDSVVLDGLIALVKVQGQLDRFFRQQRLLDGRNMNIWQTDELVRRHGITHLQCTPTRARELTDGTLDALKVLLVGGESMPEDLARRVTAKSHLSVFNMYGPTEATVWVSARKLLQGGGVFLGGPMANSQFLVLDEMRRLVPNGVRGELYISGANVSPGYWRNAELNKSRFVENPFAEAGQSQFRRMYQTGDLVRWVQDEAGLDCLQFLGRADFQVKVNGHRIEIEEIEAALSSSRHVEQSVVVLANGRLHAFVQCDEDKLFEVKALISAMLPDYMQPSGWQAVAEFALTDNGKIDRKAMEGLINISGVSEGPRNVVEHRLHQMWCDLLGVSAVSIHDSFFALGGNSILAIRLTRELTDCFPGVDFRAQDIFTYSTIAALTEVISARAPEESKSFQLVENERVEW